MADFYIAAQPLAPKAATLTRLYKGGTPVNMVHAWQVRQYGSSQKALPTGGGTSTRPTTGRLWPRPN